MRELVPRFDMHDPTSAVVSGPVPVARRCAYPVYRDTGCPRPAVAHGLSL